MAMRLTEEQLEWLAARVPEASVSAKGGRPAMDKRQALRGIFWMLDNGAKWKDLPRRFSSKSAVHRWFTMWVREGVFENLMRDAGSWLKSATATACMSASSTRRSAKRGAVVMAWASQRLEKA